MKRISALTFVGFALTAMGLNAALSPTPFVTRTVTPNQIYYSGSVQTPNSTTVTMKVTAMGDTIAVGSPLDILFVIDTSSSMGARSDSGSRISGVYNAMINFLNLSVKANDRVACRFFAGNDRLFFGFRSSATDPNFTATKNLLTQSLQAGGDGSGIYNAAYNAVQFMVQNKRPAATPLIVYLSDGGINNSITTPPIRTASEFSNYVQTFPVGTKPIFYTISIVSVVDSIPLKIMANLTGGKYIRSPSPNSLINIFDGIAQEFMTTAGIEINASSTPMLIDVLGANTHYIQGTFTGTAGNLDVAASQFRVDSSGALDQLKFSIPLIKLYDTVAISYKINAYLTTPSFSPTMTPTTTLGGATYSRLRYYRADSVIVEKPFTSDDKINVLSEISGIRLSTSASAFIAAVDQSVVYGSIAKGTLPVTLYSLAEVTASGGSHGYQNVSASWNFVPAQAWINNGTTALNNATGTQQTLTLIAGPGSGFPNGPFPLTVTYNTNYRDTVLYSGNYMASTLEGKSLVVTYSTAPVKVGDPLTFALMVLDTLNNVVTDQVLQPDSMSVTVAHRSVVNGDTVVASVMKMIPLIFDNTGHATGSFTTFTVGQNTLNISVNLPGKTPSAPTRQATGKVIQTTVPGNTTPPVPYTRIDLYNTVIPDTSNPSNIIQPGKKVRFKLQVQNNLPQNLLTLKGTIQTSDTNIIITDSIGAFNNILSGQKGWSADDFEVQINSNTPKKTTANFTLSMSDQIVTGGPWIDQFSLPLTPFEIPMVLIDDDNNPDSKGNNNDTIEPTEIAEIIPLISNLSSDSFYSPYSELTTSIKDLNIWDSVTGSTGIVFDSIRYNIVSGYSNPIFPTQLNIMPEVDFVFANNCVSTNQLDFDLIIAGYLNEAKGVSWDSNGVKLKWGVPFTINKGFPSIKNEADKKEGDKIFISNLPNPFNPSTTIYFTLPVSSSISIIVYDLNGKERLKLINQKWFRGGHHAIHFDNTNFASGLYVYRLICGNLKVTNKMVLLK